MARGGYRKPANPAPVSGPGQLSRRTDGNQPVMEMTGGAYGERKALREMQGAAPMAQQQQVTQNEMPKITSLFEPTQRPNEPATAGMPFGPGENAVVPGTPFAGSSLRVNLEKILSVNPDPDIEELYSILMKRGAI
jgi:hypothetical protein